jgi:hypothetical protein
MVADDSTFRRPNGFDDRLSEIKKKIANLRAKTSNVTFGQPNTQGSKRFWFAIYDLFQYRTIIVREYLLSKFM